MAIGPTQEQVERTARIYHRVEDASQALGITPRSYSRLCRKYGIETPYMRRRRHLADRRGVVLDRAAT